MKKLLALFLCCGLCSAAGCTGSSIQPGQSGNTSGGKTMEEYETYINHPAQFPISFTYDKTVYQGFGEEFREIGREQKAAQNGTNTILTFAHEKSGTQFVVNACVYEDYSAYEWTVSITNTGDQNTGVFENINGADMTFVGKDPCLKGINGDLGDMYAPYAVALKDHSVTKESTSGRPTHGNFPYFNLEYGSGGTFIAVGWPGCWRASFENKGNETRFTGGQHTVSTYLAPGETIRTPLMMFLKYEGRDEVKAMNLWRRWFIDCNMRKINGENFEPVFAASTMSQGMNTKSMLRIVNSYKNHGISLDYLWMDAGWYTNAAGETCSWPETGSLNVNTEMFPDRFAEISQAMAEQGGKTMLWFEPEVIRLNKDAFLAGNPDFSADWMLGIAFPGTWLEGQLVDLGNEACRAWLIEKISKVMDDGHIAMYRQDFNVDPAPVWAANDDVSRSGFTENQYVQGYLAFWDALLEKYPDMMIDSCASGGGRNDLETLRRAVPLHFSDFWDGNTGGFDERQAAMQSLIQWIPYIKLEKNTGVESTLYHLRSCYAPWINANIAVMDKDAPWDILAQVRQEWEHIQQFFYADYYPLTQWSKSSEAWRGWEFFDPAQDAGYGQLFRPANCSVGEMTIKLYGLSADKQYHVKDFDGLLDVTADGKALMAEGIRIAMPESSYSIVFCIDPVK